MSIYASATGKRYHCDPYCTGLNTTAMNNWDADVPTITHAAAHKRGLTPCKACKPRPLLTVVIDSPVLPGRINW